MSETVVQGYIYQHTVDCINWDGMHLGLRQHEMRQQVAKVAGLSCEGLSCEGKQL